MTLEDLPRICHESMLKLSRDFDEKRTETINEINSYLAESNPELHSLILRYTRQCKNPGEVIALSSMLLYVVSDGLEEKSLDAFWREL